MKIFVLHYSKLVERKQHILEQFRIHNITDYEFIEKYDKEELQDCNILFDNTLKPSENSLTMKHFYAYKLIAENHENALIFEDDVILSNDFIKKLDEYMNQTPTDFDMVFIGDGCNFHIEPHKLIPNKNIYEKCLYPTSWGGNGASKCTDSYIISKKCANIFCEYINNNLKNKINLPIDWWLNVAARDNNLKVYWAEPTIVTQGSQNGTFNRSI
jgi:GR25 family glycosyltransferase involved in LPS biosynthesis